MSPEEKEKLIADLKVEFDTVLRGVFNFPPELIEFDGCEGAFDDA